MTDNLRAPSPVLDEIEKRSTELHDWLKPRNTMFVDLDENVQLKAREILAKFPRLVGQRKNRYSADPFVIVMAIETDRILITEEYPTGNDNRPNIPDVCNNEDFNKEHINILGLIRQQRWVFS